MESNKPKISPNGDRMKEIRLIEDGTNIEATEVGGRSVEASVVRPRAVACGSITSVQTGGRAWCVAQALAGTRGHSPGPGGCMLHDPHNTPHAVHT